MSNTRQKLRINTTCRFTKDMFFVLLLLLILQSGAFSTEQPENQKAFLGITDILDAWKASYDSMHSMKVKYTMDTTLPDLKGEETILHKTVERIQDGSRFYIKNIDTNPDYPNSEMNLEAAFDGDISTYCDYRTKQGRIEQGIATNGYEEVNMLEQYMLLTRNYDDPNYPDGRSYLDLWVGSYFAASKVDDNFKVNVRPDIETILGEKCHVIEIGYRDTEQRFWFAHNKDMCPMGYELTNEKKEIICKAEVLKIAKVNTDIGDVWYPSEVEQILVDDTVNIGQTQTHRFSVQEFIPYLSDIDPDTFRLQFSKGIRIFDRVLGITYIKGEVLDALNNLDNETVSSFQSTSLEPNNAKNTFNSSLEDIAPDEAKVTLITDRKEQDRNSILGDAQQRVTNKYTFVIFACFALVISACTLFYFRYKIIKYRGEERAI